MSKKSNTKGIIIVAVLLIALLVAAILIPGNGSGSGLTLFGLYVSAAAFAGFIFVIALLVIALLVRAIVIPKFTTVPGKFQSRLEGLVKFYDWFGKKGASLRRTLFEDGKVMKKGTKIKAEITTIVLIVITLVGSFIFPGHAKTETIQEAMRDCVLHEENKIAFFGLTVNPAVVAGFILVITLLAVALLLRIFVIPRFKVVPGKLQLALEMMVGFFDNLAKTNSPKYNKFLGGYIFTAGVYIFFGTMSELLGIQLVTTTGSSMAMPAPLADINGAICLGCLSYLVIMVGSIIHNGVHGFVATIKEFSLPISMSFRLFGALLSGLLVTDLVYYMQISYILPVIVGILFTCIHALVQAYVLTMLTSTYYGECSEKKEKKKKVKKRKKNKKMIDNMPVSAGSEG